MANLDKLVEELSALTVQEASELGGLLQDRWGIKAGSTPLMLMPHPSVLREPEEEEQTEFDVVLTKIGPKRIDVIKAVRALTSFSLTASKSMVDEAEEKGRVLVLLDTDKGSAETAKEMLEKVGATVGLA